MKKVFIYTLEHPITKKIRYIGKTEQKLNKRLIAHIYESKRKNNHRNNWIFSLYEKNIKPIISLIDTVDEVDWEFWEKYWISQFKSWNFTLVNGTEGGRDYKHSKESKEKIKKATSGKNHYFYGKKHTKETREKISLGLIGNTSAKGFKHTKETCAKVSRNSAKFWLGKKRSEETKRKISKKNSNPILQFKLDGEFIKKFNSISEIEEELNIKRYGIYDCLINRTKTSHGFIWKRG